MSDFDHTGVIIPRFWRDFRGKSLEVKAAAAFLVTGRHNVGLPGCCEVSLVSLAEELEVTVGQLEKLLGEMPDGFATYDRTHRVLQVPNAPRIGHRPNHQVIRSWFRAWKALPESRLKYEHIDSLRESLPSDASELTTKTWHETFGSIVIPMGQWESEPDGLTHPRPRPRPQSSPRPQSLDPEASPDAVEVATYLLEAIRSHKADIKDGTGAWAKDIDRAIRIDKRTPERLRAVIDFAHRSTDYFWRGNLLSGSKLREHFDRLEIQAARSPRASPKVAASGGTIRSPDELAAMARERMEQERKDGLR